MPYLVGQAVRLSAAFADAAGAAIDPTLVTLTVKGPDGVVASFTSAGNPPVVKDAVGAYHYDFVTTLAGWHYYRYTGTGPATAAGQGSFVVEPSNVV